MTEALFQPGRIPRSQPERRATGAAFDDAEVAGSYGRRPPYAPDLYDFMLTQVSGRTRALDLGCGPGKVAIALSARFGEVVALDPSAAMLAEGRAAAGERANIVWVESLAEDYEDAGRFDLVTAGTSIHWPDHAVLFPKLARWTPMLAIIEGDAAPEPPCGQAAWTDFLTLWIARVGGRYDPARAGAEARRHEAWMAIEGRKQFPFRFSQSVTDFVESQHSRATWTRAVMGEALAAEFDQALTALMAPFAHDGMLDLRMVSDLTWGRPLPAPRG